MSLNIHDLLNPLPMPPARKQSALTIAAYDYEQPSQHKRMGKACIQCRCDKTRCNDERPCHGCKRKGRAQLCVDGCYRCRHERLSCDQNRPCHQCVKRGVECSDTRPSDFPPPQTKRRRRRRGLQAASCLPSSSALPSSVDSSVNDCKRECPGKRKKHDDTYSHVMASPNSMLANCEHCRRKSKKYSQFCKGCEQSREWPELPKGGQNTLNACLAYHEDGKTRPGPHGVRTELDCNDEMECEEEAEVPNDLPNIPTTRSSYTDEDRHSASPITRQMQNARTSGSATPPSPEFSSSLDETDASHQSYALRAPPSLHRIPHTLPSLHSLGLLRCRDSAYIGYKEHRHHNVLAHFNPPAHSSSVRIAISHIRSTAKDSC